MVHRSGRYPRDYLLWAAGRDGYEEAQATVRYVTMVTQHFDDVIDVPRDNESQERIETQFTRSSMKM